MSTEENLTIEYKLCMKQDAQEAPDSSPKTEKATIRSLCMDEKQIIQNINQCLLHQKVKIIKVIKSVHIFNLNSLKF